MSILYPKDFIRTVLVNEIGDIHSTHPYIAFAVMAAGIELLGKCLNSEEDWNQGGMSRKDFESAINTLDSFSRYRPYLASHNLWTSLRNGLLHSFVPKSSITLSSKDEAAHLEKIGSQVNLRCEDFYSDFKAACEEVIATDTFLSQKMNQPLLQVPDAISPNSASGHTQTIIFNTSN